MIQTLIFVFQFLMAEPSLAVEGRLYRWPESLLEVRKSLDIQKENTFSRVGLWILMPKAKLDFRSAENFRLSLLANPVELWGKIGHMAVSWECRGSGKEGFVGQSGETKNQFEYLLRNGWGLSGLYYTFTDGRMVDGQQLEKGRNRWDSAFMTKNPDPNTNIDANKLQSLAVYMDVSEEDCNKVANFVEAYTSPNIEKFGTAAFQYFGLNLDPLKLEGGGCGSFAMAALNATSLFAKAFRLFKRELVFPNWVLGDSQKPLVRLNIQDRRFTSVQRGTERSLLQVLGRSWDVSRDSPQAEPLWLIDPELVNLYIFNLIDAATPNGLTFLNLDTERPTEGVQNKALHLRRKVYHVPGGAGYPPSQEKIPNAYVIDGSEDAMGSDIFNEATKQIDDLASQNYVFTLIKKGDGLILKILQSKDN